MTRSHPVPALLRAVFVAVATTTVPATLVAVAALVTGCEQPPPIVPILNERPSCG